MNKNKRVWIIILIVFTLLLAFGLRTYAAFHLNIDHDETTYLIASNNYTNYMRNGEWTWLAWNTTNYEHPSLNKIIYGIALLTQAPLEKVQQSDLIDEAPVGEQQAVEYAMAARFVSVFFGSLAALLLAILNPLAGLFLAVDSLAIKYTSEIYLEALPMLTSLLAVIAYTKYYQVITKSLSNHKRAYLWLAVSGISLGMTAASKYVYCVAGLAIVVHWLIAVLRKKIPTRSIFVLMGWGLFSIFMFFVFDPYLWVHTIERLGNTLSYHLRFQGSAHVQNANYPIWQPLNWLFRPFASYSPIHDPYQNDAILFNIDTLIFFLSLIGLPRTFKRQPVFFLWLIIGLLMLFVWGSKWAQYPLIILAPWCFSAAQGFFTIFEFIVNKFFKKKNKLSTST